MDYISYLRSRGGAGSRVWRPGFFPTITGCTHHSLSYTQTGVHKTTVFKVNTCQQANSTWKNKKQTCRITKIEGQCENLTGRADLSPRAFWYFHKGLRIYAIFYPTTTVKQHYWKMRPKKAGTVWTVWAELCFTQLNEGMCHLCCFHWNVACIVGHTTDDEWL